MARLIFDASVIADAATAMGMTEAQVRAWYAANYETIKAVRLYIQTRKSTEEQFIEQFAIPGQAIDPTLVTQIITLLEMGGLVTTMETA